MTRNITRPLKLVQAVRLPPEPAPVPGPGLLLGLGLLQLGPEPGGGPRHGQRLLQAGQLGQVTAGRGAGVVRGGAALPGLGGVQQTHQAVAPLPANNRHHTSPLCGAGRGGTWCPGAWRAAPCPAPTPAPCWPPSCRACCGPRPPRLRWPRCPAETGAATPAARTKTFRRIPP